MLSLAAASSPSWLARAVDPARAATLLVDHAHCEKKAASTAVGFLFRYPERAELARQMSRLGREELVHFERVLAELCRRGIPFGRLPPSPYGAQLYKCVRTAHPGKLVDELLVSALIEARSCERFALLAAAHPDRELASLWRELEPAEERHAEVYVELACAAAPRDVVEKRLAELAAAEAEIVARPAEEVRLHAG